MPRDRWGLGLDSDASGHGNDGHELDEPRFLVGGEVHVAMAAVDVEEHPFDAGDHHTNFVLPSINPGVGPMMSSPPLRHFTPLTHI